MHNMKCLSKICPSSLKETTDSDSGGVQGTTDESKRENVGTVTSFGAAMFGGVYNVTCACQISHMTQGHTHTT